MKVCWRASSASSRDAEHVPAEREQAAVMAVEDDLEGALVAARGPGPTSASSERRSSREARDAGAAARGRERPCRGLSTRRRRQPDTGTSFQRAQRGAGWRLASGYACRPHAAATRCAFFRHEGCRLAYTIYGDGPRTSCWSTGCCCRRRCTARSPGRWPSAATAWSRSTCSATARSDRPRGHGALLDALLRRAGDRAARPPRARRGGARRDLAGRQRDARGRGRARPSACAAWSSRCPCSTTRCWAARSPSRR